MLQIISFDGISSINNNNVRVSKLESPQSLDEFLINVIDLSSEEIWTSSSDDTTTVDYMTDFINLNKMIQNSQKTKVVVILPQNLSFSFRNRRIGRNDFIELKNILNKLVKNVLFQLLGFGICDIMYENTKTDINRKEIDSAFYFYSTYDVITKSKKSLKTTSIRYKEMFIVDILLTTLNLKTYEDMIALLRTAQFIEDKTEIPKWILDLEMFDDVQQKNVIEISTKAIKKCEEKIGIAQIQIDKNNEYKSILYTNGDELVNVVFEMLEQLLDSNLSDFEDEKKEDFLIKKNDITFIGEIKGVSSNVKSEHVSQLEVHLQTHLDKNTENQINEEVKSLLIINPLRNCDLKDRQPVHENQINLAIKYGSLIIETITLLKLFEMLKRHEISSNECIDLFKDRVGLLEI